MIKSFIVDSTCNEMRLDRYLRNKLGKIPQALIEKNLRFGKIKVNRRKSKSSFKVKTNDKIDIFDFNPKHKRAGIGIVISEPYQKEGFASDALSLLISYCFEVLDLHQLFANITSNNKHSITLFTSNGFKKCGEKKDWLFTNGEYKNELTFQLIHE